MSAHELLAARPHDAQIPAGPASPWRVLGTGLTLLAFLAALAWLGFGLSSRPVDGAQEQRELFGETPPPLGLVFDSAVRLPSGDVLVRFAREDALGAGPSEVLFLTNQRRSAVDALFKAEEALPMGGGRTGDGEMEEQDPSKKLAEWEKDKAFDWHFTMKRGEIAWGEWRTKYLIERSFRKGDAWYEEARVDLRTPERALVLFVHWPRETAVEESELRTLLRALVFAPHEKQ